MYTKTIIASVLIAFICVQFAESLVCYTCTTPNDCKKPKKTTCSNAAANETSHHLAVYHQGVINATSTRFDCMSLQYTWNNQVIHQLHGCLHPAVGPCNLSLKPAYGHYNKTHCRTCSGDKCNKSPAGKVSSSIYTILAGVVGLLLVKTYA
ncbi:uncharacterized protein LOC108163793 [Drosophila miranda]|uniref:uncharacterized protein LOC108163793 n=1 Tax=Drosophila miranda TaxID=7229 RepID=UPI0007E82FEE|nr:uncharacterized protein LOC108163793 [Drosophila miranda]